MVGRHPWLALAIAAFLGLPVFGSGSAAEPLGPGFHTLEVELGGGTRDAFVTIPPQAAGGDPLPVVLSFHGGGGSPEQHRAQTGFDVLAEQEGFIAVHPRGTKGWIGRLHSWNAGACCGRAAKRQVDDVGFVLALIDALAERTAVDRRRVFVTGHSNGAKLALRLAEERPEHFRGVVSVGAIRTPSSERALAIPVLHIHSVDDPRALYAGGLGPPFPFTRTRVDHPAAPAVLERWRETAGCEAAPERTDLRHDGDHRAERWVWSCPGTMRLEHWKLYGAGHGWPGTRKPGHEGLIGPPSQVIDASAEAWRFFASLDEAAG